METRLKRTGDIGFTDGATHGRLASHTFQEGFSQSQDSYELELSQCYFTPLPFRPEDIKMESKVRR